MNMADNWWQFRRDELLTLADRQSPLIVFNEEVLNEIFFDLLSMDAIDRLFYPLQINSHPKIVQKASDLGVGFRCVSFEETDMLNAKFPQHDPKQIVFCPPDALDRDSWRALDQGFQVVVNDLRASERRPDLFRGREFFIRGDMRPDPGGIGIAGTRVKGCYLYLERDAYLSSNLEGLISFLQQTLEYFPERFTFILGNDAPVEGPSEAGIIDIPRFEDCLKAILQACPQADIWAEVPVALLSSIGVLMTGVLETGEDAGIRYIRIDAKLKSPGYDVARGFAHRIVNLSRPNQGEARSITRIIGQDAGLGNTRDFSGVPAVVEEGDLLLFTQMGACACPMDLDNARHGDVPTYYLQARSMCPVKI